MIIIFLEQLLHLIIVSRLEFISFPEFYLYPYLTAKGLIPYTQIIDQHFPGFLLLPVNFFRLGISTPQSFKVLLLSLIFLQSLFLVKLVRRYTGQIFTPVFTSLAYLFWQPVFSGSSLWYDTLLPVLTLPALFFWLGENYLISGLLLGLALVIKQTVVILVTALFLYLVWRRKYRSAFKFFIASVFPITAVLIYFYFRGNFFGFINWTIIYNFFTYPKLASYFPPLNLLVPLVFPALLGIYFVFKHSKTPLIRFGAVWMVLSLAGSLSRFDYLHLHSAVPFLALIIGVGTAGLWQHRKYILLGGIILITLIYQIRFYSHQRNWGMYHFFDSDTLSASAYITGNVPSGSEIFLLGAQPHIYALTGTLPAGKLFVYQLPWYLKSLEPEVLSNLQLHPPRYVIYDSSASVDGQPVTSYAPALIKYVLARYQPVRQFGSLSVYEIRP